jgi:hypothetical protein
MARFNPTTRAVAEISRRVPCDPRTTVKVLRGDPSVLPSLRSAVLAAAEQVAAEQQRSDLPLSTITRLA